MRQFGQIQQQVFIKRLIREIQATWIEECQIVGSEQLPLFIEHLVSESLGYGIMTEYDVARYVTIAFALRKGDFHRLPWVSQILNQPDLPARVKMNWIWRRLESIFTATSESSMPRNKYVRE